MVTDPITSPTNPRIKDLVRLRSRRARDRSGTFVIEGYRELTRAFDGDVSLSTLYVCPDLFLGENETGLVDRFVAQGVEVITVAPEPFRKASYRDRPEGLIGVADQFDTGMDRIPMSGPVLLLVAESIEKPGNLGTMLRTAEAAGADGVIVADPTTDPFNPNVVRASVGAVFSIPLAVGDSDDTIETLRSAGISIVATTPDATTPHHQADLADACAVVVGSEQYGLSNRWLSTADRSVVIEMPGSVDSLNAAMSAGIVLFEAVRQRSIR